MDVLLASAVFAIVFIPTIVYLGNRAGVTDGNRLALQRMRPEEVEDLGIMRRKRPDSGLSEWLMGIDLLRVLEENLWQAGIYIRVSDVILIMVILFAAGVASGAYFWHDNLYAFGMGAGFGALPLLYIRFRRQRRLKAFSKQLPYALDMIKSSLQAGHTFQRSLLMLASEFKDPLGGEFRTVTEQTRIGLPVARALEELLTRVPEEDLRLLVVSVKVQAQIGSSLAELVGRLSEIVRARQRLRLQVQALTAQAKLGGMLVAVLPIIVLAVFSIIEPEYTRTLFTDPTGLKILKTALACDVVAFVWIRKLLKVSY